jgi:intracellular sulfur oxidation DsrE/DsrF family protein
MMRPTWTLTGLSVALAALALAGEASRSGTEPSTGPVIEGYGPVFDVPSPDFTAPVDVDYRAVFDVAAGPGDPSLLAPSIVTVARFLNMHARAGVPRDRLHAALVLHGEAGKYALGHEAYRKRFGTDNPNLDLLERLREAGARVILCGQTAGSRGFARDELAESVELALSAMTALVVLQQEGYELIAF